MGQSIEYLDAIRGFAIILVVIGHAIAWSYTDWHEICLYVSSQPSNYKIGGMVWQIIYSFHMALFFVVSGFLSGNSIVTKQSIISKVQNKVIRLLIPYFATGYLIYFVRGNWGYWFLLALFIVSILWLFMSLLLNRINHHNSIWIDIVVMGMFYFLLRLLAFYIPVTGIVLNSNVLKYFVPFCFGVLMKRHQGLAKMVQSPYTFTVCLILFVLLFSTRYITDYPILYKTIEKVNFFTSVLAILACVVVFHMFIEGVPQKYEKCLAYLGRNSLPIYILHILFVIQIHEVGCFILQQNAVTSITLQIVYSLIISAIAISLSLFTYRVLRHSALIRLLMFGEKE